MNKKIQYLLIGGGALGALVLAALAGLYVTGKTSPMFGGQSFGAVGQYEEITGIAEGEIDPADRRNSVITGIPLAPKNANGRAAYKTTFTIV